MLYVKNLPVWERLMRVLGGLILLGLMLLGIGGPWAMAIMLFALILFVTGFIGFCPACALAGRRMTKRNSPE